jgi:hypothetical protein
MGKFAILKDLAGVVFKKGLFLAHAPDDPNAHSLGGRILQVLQMIRLPCDFIAIASSS